MAAKDDLLLEIARCPVVTRYFDGDISISCSEIIACQQADTIHDFQVPEPWNGDIKRAPILFLSSNPSIDETEAYPTNSWSDEQLTDYFKNRFGGGKKEWVKDGKYGLRKDGSYKRVTPYWSEIQNRASELLGRGARPGIDYALTEVVHCKSRAMEGVEEALLECGKRYLNRVLSYSRAKVIAVVGKKTQKSIYLLLNIHPKSKIITFQDKRLMLFLAAPNSNEPRKITKVFNEEEIKLIRKSLDSQ